jgi:hypothetical protein
MSETELRAFHGDQAVKDKYLVRVRAHREADELVQRIGFDGGKGCAVGCTLDAYDHSRYPVELGIPIELAHLEDFIFESLSKEDAMGWPERFLSSAKPGADLRMVWDRFTLWILIEEHPDRGEHCARMGKLFERHINGDTPTKKEWDMVAMVARDAMAASSVSSARDVRAARDAWVAWDARGACGAEAAGAAWDARYAWAAWEARAASISRMADKLIDLMAQAPL